MRRKTKKQQKIGLITFWLAALYGIGMSWLASWWGTPIVGMNITEQINGADGLLDNTFFLFWFLSVSISIILAGMGILLYTKTKVSRILWIGIGVLAAFLIIDNLSFAKQSPTLFGMFGGLISISFVGILWFWGKKRAVLKIKERAGADLELIGYEFFMIAIWYLAGVFGRPDWLTYPSGPLADLPEKMMILLSLGWIFLLLGHYKTTKALIKKKKMRHFLFSK